MLKVLFKAIIISSILLVGASCSPSESSIATAIALTEMASPSDTPTAIPSPTFTPLPSPTYTPVPSPTPTPTPDTRVYDDDPYNFLLKRLDLPTEADYYLPHSSWTSPHRNKEVVFGLTADEAKEYLANTGRVDGWFVAFKRGSRTVIAPEEIYDNPVLYKTIEGAQTMLDEYSQCTRPDTDYTLIEVDFVIGDNTKVCMNKVMQNSGKNRVWIRIDFISRNVFHGVVGWGWENEVTIEYVEQIARILLEKLQKVPLSGEVTFKP